MKYFGRFPRQPKNPVAQPPVVVTPAVTHLINDSNMKLSNLNFTLADIIDLPLLAAKLVKLSNAALQYIASRLSEKTRGLLTAYTADSSVTAELSAALADDFTSIIKGPGIYDEQRFVDVPLSAKLRKRLGQELQGNALVHANRLALEAALVKEVAQRLNKKRVQKWINLKGGLRRLKGENVIHGRVKIKGKESSTTFKTRDEDKARDMFHAWVAELRKSIKQACTVKESLASFVEPYLRSRSDEVVRKEIKPGTITGLRRTYESIGQHWLGFKTVSLSRITPKAMGGIVKFLLTKAKNLVQPGKTISPATYNGYMSALALLLGYLKQEGKISQELYHKLKDKIKYAYVPPRKVPMPTADQLKTMRARLYRVRQGKSRGESGPKFDAYMLSGQRKATVNAMKVEHFNFEKGEVYLTNLKGHAHDPSEVWRPMVPELAEIMERYIKERGLKEGQALWQTRNNNNALRSAAKAVGLVNWYHQACRKWFGTTGLKETHDPLAVSDLMCHRDGGKTLLTVYRQVCTEHLHGTTSTLKMYPGANAGKSLAAATARAERVLKRVLNSPQAAAVKALDCILWIEAKLDCHDYAALDQLPSMAQENLPIYRPNLVGVAGGSTPTLIKNNLKFLVQKKEVYHSDIAAATGIKRSAIAVASKFGDLQARYLPALCTYFGVTLDEFLNCELAAPSVPGDQPQPIETNGAHPVSSEKTADKSAPEPTIGDLITRQDPAALLRVVARNLTSILFEKNLTTNALAKKAGSSHTVIGRFIREEFVPTDASIQKLAKALGVKETDIVDPDRKILVISPLVLIANLKALIAHSGLAASTYFVRLKLDDRNMQKVLATGNISTAQAHRIVQAGSGAFSLCQLVSEDLTAKFPAAPKIDSAVVHVNLGSLCWERGLYPAEIARNSSVSFSTALNYAEGRSKRIRRPLLTRIADSLGMTLAELVNPLRPVTEVTPFFKFNVQFLLDQSGLAQTAFAERCGLDHRALRSLLEGSGPNPHQVARLCANLKVTPLEVLTKDLRQNTKTETHAGHDAPPVAEPDSNGQLSAEASDSAGGAESKQ